jgi:hypothetical protein
MDLCFRVAPRVVCSQTFQEIEMTTLRPNQSAAANRRPAGQAGGSDDLSAIVAADRPFLAAVAELGR